MMSSPALNFDCPLQTMTPFSADTDTTLWYLTGLYDVNFKYSLSKKWWSHLRRSCLHLQHFLCRQDHNADADAIMKYFTWSKTEKLREWPHDRTQFPADGITTPRLLYIRSLVHDVIKIEVHDRVCIICVRPCWPTNIGPWALQSIEFNGYFDEGHFYQELVLCKIWTYW